MRQTLANSFFRVAGIVLVLSMTSCGGGSTSQSESEGAADNGSVGLIAEAQTEPSVDSEEVPDVVDLYPEDPSCNTEADIDTENSIYGNQCMSHAAIRSEFIVTSDDGVSYFGDDSLRTLYVMDLGQNPFLPQINYLPQIGWDNRLTALAYSNAQDRIYMGFSNGVILYSSSDNVVKTFSELDHPIIALTEAGEHLSVQYESGSVGDSYPRHDLMDRNANIVNTMGGHFSNSNANSPFGVWNSERQSITLISNDELLSYSYEESGILGSVIYRKRFDVADNKNPFILAVSPDGKTYITSDLAIHNETNKNLIVETKLALPENAKYNYELIWTATNGLFLLSKNIIGGSFVVRYNDELEIINVYEVNGDVDDRPFDMHVTEDSIFVLSQKFGSQMYVHSFSL